MHRTLILVAVTVALLSCQRQPEQQTSSAAAPPNSKPLPPQNLGNAKVNEVLPMAGAEALSQSHLGAPGADGRVSADKDSFKSGEPVAVTITLRDAPKGARLTARWYDAKGKQLAEESKVLSGENGATFGWKGKKLKPGTYRVSTFWGENLAGDHKFTITK